MPWILRAEPTPAARNAIVPRIERGTTPPCNATTRGDGLPLVHAISDLSRLNVDAMKIAAHAARAHGRSSVIGCLTDGAGSSLTGRLGTCGREPRREVVAVTYPGPRQFDATLSFPHTQGTQHRCGEWTW